MEYYQLIDLCKELVTNDKIFDGMNIEIRFWRQKFLESQPGYENKIKESYVAKLFHMTPTLDFMKKSPEDNIRSIENMWEQYENKHT